LTRRSLRRRLAERGFEGTRLEGARGRLGTNAATQAEQLGAVLEELGPPGQAFGSYLSSRVDLFPAVAREPLAAAGRRCPPLDRNQVRQLLRAELADEPETVFGELELLGSGPVFEWHRGELASGERVVLKLLRPELPEALETGLLPLVWLVDSLGMSELREALEGWRAGLRRRLDLRRERQGLAGLSAEAFVALSRTDVSPRLCWYRAPEGRSLVDELRDARRQATSSARARQVAQWLALAWFEEALLAGRVPDELEAPDLWVLDTDRVAMGGGHFRTLTLKESASAQVFLSAVAREEPDAAAHSMLSLLTSGREAEQGEQLVLRFRRAEPFREGLGFEPYRGRRLADQLFVLWRQCHAAGYHPTPGLLAVERGVAQLEGLVRHLAPESDALGSSLDDVRVLAAVRDLRQQLAPSRLPTTLSRSVPPLLEALRRAERTMIADAPERPHGRADSRTGTGASGWPVLLGAMGLLAAATWLAQRVLPRTLGSTAGDHLAAVLVVLVGGAALWWLAREAR
jgi:hypothetical protein